MCTPLIIDRIHKLNAVSTTPAICLTQDLPFQQAADILLLGCGDVGNILFTTFADTSPPRQLDITCCDVERTIIARNILLFTLLLDDTNGKQSSTIWAIYYHLYIEDDALKLLHEQSKKLQRIATSIEAWHQSDYGKILRFGDTETFNMVKEAWKSYCFLDMPVTEKNRRHLRFQRQIQAAKGTGQLLNSGENNSEQSHVSLRAAALTAQLAMKDLNELRHHYWKHGGTGKPLKKKNPNPMFVPIESYDFTLPHTLDPIHGFHLSMAYIPIEPNSPLRVTPKMPANLGVHKMTAAAYLQFSAWSTSFRVHARSSLILRFVAGDTLTICRKLRLGNRVQFQRRSQFKPSSKILDAEDYEKRTAPVLFDIIHTSDLAIHLGAINILVAASPLLKPTFLATLYIEDNITLQGEPEQQAKSLLCGDFSTISMILGLTPVQYWVNDTFVSSRDEDFHATVVPDYDPSSIRTLISWRNSIPAPDFDGHRPKVGFSSDDLSNLLYIVYQTMLPCDEISELVRLGFMPHYRQFDLLSFYHSRSFVELLKFIKDKVEVDWDDMMGKFINLIAPSCEKFFYHPRLQDLCTQLYIHEVFTGPIVGRHKSTVYSMEIKSEFLNGPGSWKDLPPTLNITLKMPRASLESLMLITPGELRMCNITCTLEVDPQLETQRKWIEIFEDVDPPIESRRKWLHIFTDVDLVFGQVKNSSKVCACDDGYQRSIIPDKKGWDGKSDLFATFRVPTWIVLLEPQVTNVSFALEPMMPSLRPGQREHQPYFFKARLTDNLHVFVTKPVSDAPKICVGSPSSKRETSNSAAISVEPSVFTATMNSQKDQITTLTGRIEKFPTIDKERLSNKDPVTLKQFSPFTLSIKIGDSRYYNYKFPAPVIGTSSRTRISRKEFYIEVIAPIADHQNGGGFSSFLYPIFRHNSEPVLWNVPSVNLSRLPSINSMKANQFQWLEQLLISQASPRQKKLTKRSLSKNAKSYEITRPINRTAMSEMFRSFFGYLSAKSPVIILNKSTVPQFSIILIISSVKYDLANQNVILDAAVVKWGASDYMVQVKQGLMPVMLQEGSFVIDNNEEEMMIWKQNLPAYVERCRQWEHLPSCEYKEIPIIPKALDDNEMYFCSCAKGKFPPRYLSHIPGWDKISKHAVRAAISPSFTLRLIEDYHYQRPRQIRHYTPREIAEIEEYYSL